MSRVGGGRRSEPEDLGPTERWFIRHGIPHFIADYRADTDIWTRALTLLVGSYTLTTLWGLDPEWTWQRNAAGAAISASVLLGIWLLANVVAGRPVFARPARISRPELAIFVLGPLIPPALFGESWTEVASTLLLGIGFLVLIYLVTSFGLLWILAWAGRHVLLQGASMGRLLAKALPLLLLVVTFFFLTQETWQVLGPLDALSFWGAIGLFGGIGLVFLVTRAPGELKELNEFGSWDEVRALSVGTPVEAAVLPSEGIPVPPPLDRRQWVNAGLLVLFSQIVQTAVVMFGVGALFVVFGVIAIPPSTVELWTGETPSTILSFGSDHELTVQLLRVATFLAVFTGLSFSVQQATDPTYRESFRDDIIGEIRQAFAVREAYLWTRAEATSSESGRRRPPPEI